MGPIRTIAAVACGAMLLTSAATTTAQTTQDRTTFVTFSGPVSIPGKTLPAGTYTFKLADSPADRHIVQVFDKEQTKLFATLLAVPADRTEAEGDPVITFKETAADRPPAVRYWYYAGERSGNEFVYPKNQALMIARASGESVMSVDTESTDINDWKAGQTSRVTATGEAQPATTASTTSTASTSTTTASTTTADTTTAQPTTTAAQPTTTAAQPTSQPTTTAEQPPVSTPQTTAPTSAPAAATTATAPETERPVGTSGRSNASELPHTASEVPAVGLLGLLALGGALVLRTARRATV